MRICYVCNEMPPASSGGIGTCVRTTALALARLGHDVHVVGIYDRAFDWQAPGITMHALPAPRWKYASPLTARVAIRSAISGIHHHRTVDIVEWPDSQGLFLMNVPGTVDVVRNHGPVLSHRLAGVDGGSEPSVALEIARHSRDQIGRILCLSGHRDIRRLAARFVRYYAELRTLRTIPNWIGVSYWFFNEWTSIVGVRPQRSIIIYNPVDCDLFRPDASTLRDENLILYAGSLIERKGVYALAAGARLFLKRLPSARLMFVGRELDGPARARILQHIDSEERERVCFRDAVPQNELAVLMRRCALFAMPSILESFGNVWAEAMASSTPVLGSTMSAGPEIVTKDVAGVLVNPREPEEIAKATVLLMSNPALRRKLGENGRRIALAKYSLDTGVQRTLEFYERCRPQ